MRKIKGIITVVAAMIFGATFLNAPKTWAAEDVSDVVFEILPSISVVLNNSQINLNLNDNGFHTGSVNVTASTNNATGYKTFVKTNKDYTYLKHSNASVSTNIPSISGTNVSTSAFPATGWGYSLNGTTFNAIPKTETMMTQKTTGGDEVIPFYIGSKVAGGFPSGVYSNELVFTVIANAPTERTAKAVLGDNKNLNFVYNTKQYNVGDTYEDNLGTTTVVAVYDVPVASSATTDLGWIPTEPPYKRSDITSMNIDASFRRFEPTSIAYWFYRFGLQVKSITNLRNLNVSKVTNMERAFQGAQASEIKEIESWDVSKVTNMNYTLYGISFGDETELDLSKWNTSSVTTMDHTFAYFGEMGTPTARTYLDLSGWDTSSVTTMNSMFNGIGYYWGDETAYTASSLTIRGLDNWDTHNVRDMENMFWEAGAHNREFNIGNLSKWDVSSVTTMSYMFNRAAMDVASFNIGDLSGWNTGSVTDMNCMFEYAAVNASSFYIGNITNWDVSKVGDHYNFSYGSPLTSEPNWAN